MADKKVKNESELSEKYSILKHYKKLAYTFMFISTGYAMYVIYLVLENNDSTLLLILIVSYSITIFSLFCLTKIIDFLFDLDSQDKINMWAWEN